jgi:AGZA family xanthine/uracil permease-like MFS transporter
MRVFVPRDLDGFFGLFVDNLVQLLLIAQLCSTLCGMQGRYEELLYGAVLPGAAVSILVGNLYYAWQAHRLAARESRDDVTALPYGINTPSLLVYVFFVMKPTFDRTGDPDAAWRMGLLACFGSGLIEFAGAFVAERIRRHTPRAALLSTLAGIAIGFISMTFALQIWARPILAMAPMAVVLITYFSKIRFPLGLPGGLVAILVGTAFGWILPTSWTGGELNGPAVVAAWERRDFALPVWCGTALWSVVSTPQDWLGFLSVIIPMGLFNVIGSLQNIESAEAAGDRYHTGASLAVNGMGTIAAALFGSCFPTTIYIGHPGWKGLGARAGYSSLNGLVITVMCLSGTVLLVSSLVPLEAGIAIVLWIGIVITAQAFQATRREHAPAVAVGLFPAIAAWGATVVFGAFLSSGGSDMQAVLQRDANANVNGFLLHGLLVIERGYIFTCMTMAAVSACLIDRRFRFAAAWCLAGAAATFVGLTHAYQLAGNIVDFLLIGAPLIEGATVYRGYEIAAGYLVMAGVFVGIGIYHERVGPSAEPGGIV